jgi:AcrR family transcriptional regulator
MAPRLRVDAEDVRARILTVAEEHFRRIGYAKTAVADIAAALSMSPANVYRYFPSKGAINEAIAERILSECIDALQAIALEPRPAAERLADMMLALHRFYRDNFITERRVHDMVEAAMMESWSVVQAHIDREIALVGEVIRQGIVAGEFAVQDVSEAALSFAQAHVAVTHPVLIAQCADTSQEDDVRRLTRYALRALKA